MVGIQIERPRWFRHHRTSENRKRNHGMEVVGNLANRLGNLLANCVQRCEVTIFGLLELRCFPLVLIGMISARDGTAYVYDALNGNFTSVGVSPYYEAKGSCQTLMYNDVPAGMTKYSNNRNNWLFYNFIVYFPGLDESAGVSKVVLWYTETN